MTQITLTNELRQKLLNLATPLELCDEAGQVVALVIPQGDVSRFVKWEPPYDEEELRRIENAPGPRYTLAQVMERLKKIP